MREAVHRDGLAALRDLPWVSAPEPSTCREVPPATPTVDSPPRSDEGQDHDDEPPSRVRQHTHPGETDPERQRRTSTACVTVGEPTSSDTR